MNQVKCHSESWTKRQLCRQACLISFWFASVERVNRSIQSIEYRIRIFLVLNTVSWRAGSDNTTSVICDEVGSSLYVHVETMFVPTALAMATRSLDVYPSSTICSTAFAPSYAPSVAFYLMCSLLFLELRIPVINKSCSGSGLAGARDRVPKLGTRYAPLLSLDKRQPFHDNTSTSF